VAPVPDQLLLTKSGSAVNRTRDHWVRSRELSPVDHRSGRTFQYNTTKGTSARSVSELAPLLSAVKTKYKLLCIRVAYRIAPELKPSCRVEVGSVVCAGAAECSTLNHC
jgi:hypothetical protein